MGWRYRKSINLGFGFRINLSKSGIGYSLGVPGYRITKMANGGSRTTYSLSGTGISYVKQTGKNSGKNQNSSDRLFTGEVEKFENTPIDINKDDPILKAINKTLTINRLANTFLWMTLLVYFNPIFSLCLIIGIILKIIVAATMKMELYYEFDDESRKMYGSLKEVLIILSNSKKLWQVNTSTRIYNTKYSGGAAHDVDRNNAFVTNKLPSFINTNIKIYGLNLKNQKVFFTPDRILVFRPFRKAFGCTYNDMYISIDTTNFVESERVYSDVEVVDRTWRYVNRDGGRDLRFNNNRSFPVCKYGELIIKSDKGINTIIEFSNHTLSDSIEKNLILFGNQFNRNLARSRDLLPEQEKQEIKEEEKTIITSIEELKNYKPQNNIENKEEKVEVKEEVIKYRLPQIGLLKDEESKKIIPYIDEIKKEKCVLVPIGIKNNKDIILEKISSMPNMLIGGTVMSGKTSYINTIISSILLTRKPNETKLLIYDSKTVDYMLYNGIPHLLCPVITDSRKLSIALQMICHEVELRIEKLKETSTKNIDQYNKKVDDKEKCQDYIIIIDDFSTLNSTDEINSSIEYISANGWKVNIYIIVAANHPSARVIPTVSKANFPARLSFKVASSQASQIIIDNVGAEKLTGFGNALYTSRLKDSIIKIKVPYIIDDDITNIVDYWKKQAPAKYSLLPEQNKPIIDNLNDESYDDPLYNEVVEFAVQTGRISASILQRRFRLGYNRSARLIDLLEERGIIGPQNGSQPREVLVKLVDKDGE